MLAIEWFQSNYMKLNHNKCHFLIYGHKHEVIFAKVGRLEKLQAKTLTNYH